MIQKEKYIKNMLLVAVLIVLIIFGVIISLYQYKLIKNDIQSDIKIENNYVYRTFNTFLNNLKKDITLKTNFMLETPGAREAFNNLDRDKLYSLVKKQYQRMVLQNKYLKIMTFRLSDGTTFLRVHKPHMFGDKLNKKRKIILDTISTQKRQYGFEVGKLKMTYRIVTPIFYNKKLIGVIEVGVEPEYISNNINQLFEMQTALLIKKDAKSVSLDKSKMKRLDSFLLARGDEVFQENLSNINLKKELNNITYKKDEYLVHTMLNLNNHKGDVAAKILLAYDMKVYNDKLNHLVMNSILITTAILLILFVILNLGLSYFIRKLEEYHINIIEKDQIIIQHSKMAAMGEMLESIAHQWRQPLSVITTSSSSMKMQNELNILDDEHFSDFCDNITNSAFHLSQTIDDFRDFFKQDKEKDKFILANIFHNTLNLIGSQFKNSGIEIIENIDDIEMVGFKNELIQVFINILNNAKDELEKMDGKKLIFVDIYEDKTAQAEGINGNIIIKIKDNAGGISKDILLSIFNAHFTTKEDTDGTGIGLHMSKKIIIDNFNGLIEANNEHYSYEEIEYTGAEFTIVLPL